jgi:DNA-binding response OmpR family regulator
LKSLGKAKVINCDEFELDEEGYTIKKNGEPLNLTSAEYELLIHAYKKIKTAEFWNWTVPKI